MEKIFFNNCLVTMDMDTGFVETIFDDQTSIPSFPLFNNEVYFWTAKDLGYEGNLRKMCIDHEIIHTFISEAMGFDYSPTLWANAHFIEYEKAFEEEAIVLSFQKFLNKRKIEPILIKIEDLNNIDLKKLRKEAINILPD